MYRIIQTPVTKLPVWLRSANSYVKDNRVYYLNYGYVLECWSLETGEHIESWRLNAPLSSGYLLLLHSVGEDYAIVIDVYEGVRDVLKFPLVDGGEGVPVRTDLPGNYFNFYRRDRDGSLLTIVHRTSPTEEGDDTFAVRNDLTGELVFEGIGESLMDYCRQRGALLHDLDDHRLKVLSHEGNLIPIDPTLWSEDSLHTFFFDSKIFKVIVAPETGEIVFHCIDDGTTIETGLKHCVDIFEVVVTPETREIAYRCIDRDTDIETIPVHHTGISMFGIGYFYETNSMKILKLEKV